MRAVCLGSVSALGGAIYGEKSVAKAEDLMHGDMSAALEGDVMNGDPSVEMGTVGSVRGRCVLLLEAVMGPRDCIIGVEDVHPNTGCPSDDASLLLTVRDRTAPSLPEGRICAAGRRDSAREHLD